MLTIVLALLFTGPVPPPPPKPVCRMSKVSCARLQKLLEEDVEYLGTWDPIPNKKED